MAQALDPAANIRARTVLGGPAPAEMARLLRASGNEAEAAQYARQSEKLKKDAEELQQKRWNMGMPL